MSQFLTRSPQHCAKQRLNIEKHYKKAFWASATFLASVLSFIFLIWLILHPTKPEFSVKELDVYQLNLSAPHLLSSSIQLTLLSRNPNKKVGIYYDELQVYATYKSQQITGETTLPPFHQPHEDSSLLTATLVGAALPVSPTFWYEFGRDQKAGKPVLSLEMKGKLRWKVGTWVSRRYGMNVNCLAMVPLGPSPSPAIPSPPLSLKQGTLPQCSTTV